MIIRVDDKGLFAAMLDEAEELIKKPFPDKPSAAKLRAEKTAKAINQITEKAAEIIDEKTEEVPFSPGFSVELPERYYKTIDGLTKQADELKKIITDAK